MFDELYASKSSRSTSIHIIIQSKSAFNYGFILGEINYDIWSQKMETHIAKREKLSYICGKDK